MPNHVVLATGAVVVVGVAVATAVAIYESPEVRQYAEDVRRRIAIALHSMGNNIDPAGRAPLFNRPEDAEGFLESRRGAGAEDGVDADEETRRRQREELLYWNSVRLQKQDQQEREQIDTSSQEPRPALTEGGRRGSSFEDFLSPDKTSNEPGTFVFNTGADVRPMSGGLRHRSEGPRGFASTYANPFADENQIDSVEMGELDQPTISPARDEVSDIYSATTREDVPSVAAATPEPASTPLFDADMYMPSESSATLDRELGNNEFVTAGQEEHDAYSSIQAWAQNSSQDFYSPLPVTPSVAASEPELISEGELTPTDSISLVGAADDVANDVNDVRSRDGEASRYFDVMSESSGMMTPASWSEVGSVISESDAAVPVRS